MWQARRQARKAIEGDEATAAEDENGLPARAVLNTLKAAKPRGPRARRAAGPSAAPQAAAGLSRPKRKGLFGAAPDSENRPSGGAPPCHLTVYKSYTTSSSLTAVHKCARSIICKLCSF